MVRLYDTALTPAALPTRGERIVVEGRFASPRAAALPGTFDERAWLRRRGVIGTVTPARHYDVTVIGREKPGVVEAVRIAVRERIDRFVDGTIGGEEGALATALLIGDRAGIDEETRDAYAMTGTAHVLALSGLHVGVIVLALFVILSWVPARWLRFTLIALSLAAYVVLTGSGASILRAAVMAVLFLGAYNLGRVARPFNTLGLTGLLLLILDPAFLFDIGFQLSFAAVGGIVLLYGPMCAWLRERIPLLSRSLLLERTAQAFVLSLSAQLFTLPLTIGYFGAVSLISPFINLLVVPLTSIGFGAATVGVLLADVPIVAGSFGAAAYLTIAWATDLVLWAADLSWAQISIATASWVTMAVLTAALVWFGFARSGISRLTRLASVLLLAIVCGAIESRRDPLAASRTGYVYTLPISRTGGIATACHHGDTLTVWYESRRPFDAPTVARRGEELAERIAARHLRIVDLRESPDTSHRAADLERFGLHRVNRHGPEYLSMLAPVLLSNTERREAGVVRIGETSVLQIPMQGVQHAGTLTYPPSPP